MTISADLLRTGQRVAYMAHPFGGDPANLARAKRWLRYLVRANPHIDFCAPWIPLCEVLNDASPLERERMLSFDCRIVAVCHAIFLVGGRISAGMQKELEAAWDAKIPIVDLNSLGEEPPVVFPET